MTFTAGQVLTAAQLNALELGMVPIGSVTMFGGSSAPTGWLLCDGSAVSRTTYAALFAVISDSYGVGNGTTTFNLPNLKGRVPVGRDSTDNQFDVLGESGGAKTHTLTSAEMPSHTHTQDAHTHTQNAHKHTQDAHTHTNAGHAHNHSHIHITTNRGINVNYGSQATALGVTNGGGTYGLAGTTDTDPTSTNTASISIDNATATNQNATATNNNATATNQNTGGSGAHNNLQPYLILNFIIKS